MNTNVLSISTPGASLDDLMERARTLMENARSVATRSGYSRDVGDYKSFCQRHGFCAIPSSPPVLALYLAGLSTRLRPATIARRMAAIADASKRAGYGTDALKSFAVQETWKGIRRTLGVAPEVKTPLTASAIRQIVRACPDTLIGKRDRLLLLVGFAGGFRRSELVSIGFEHLTFEPNLTGADSVTIFIPKSKTDQEGEGRNLTLLRGSTQETCPVAAIRDWIDASGARTGRFLRSVDRHGKLGAGIHPDSIPRILKRAAARANIPINIEDIAGGSLRSGLVTQASLEKMSPLAVMEVTGHRTMRIVNRYFRAQLAGGRTAAGAGL